MPVKPIPEGYHTVTPMLSVKGAARLIDFMKKAFGATENYRFPAPDGSVMHAELKVGDSFVMLGEAMKGSSHVRNVLCLRAGCRCDVPRRPERRGRIAGRAGRSVLGRPCGHHQRFCRKQVDDRHPRGGRKRRRTRKAGPGSSWPPDPAGPRARVTRDESGKPPEDTPPVLEREETVWRTGPLQC